MLGPAAAHAVCTIPPTHSPHSPASSHPALLRPNAAAAAAADDASESGPVRAGARPGRRGQQALQRAIDLSGSLCAHPGDPRRSRYTERSRYTAISCPLSGKRARARSAAPRVSDALPARAGERRTGQRPRVSAGSASRTGRRHAPVCRHAPPENARLRVTGTGLSESRPSESNVSESHLFESPLPSSGMRHLLSESSPSPPPDCLRPSGRAPHGPRPSPRTRAIRRACQPPASPGPRPGARVHPCQARGPGTRAALSRTARPAARRAGRRPGRDGPVVEGDVEDGGVGAGYEEVDGALVQHVQHAAAGGSSSTRQAYLLRNLRRGVPRQCSISKRAGDNL